MALASLYVVTKRFKQSEQIYVKLSEVYPKDTDSLLNYAVLMKNVGQMEKALDLHKKTL